MDLRSTLSKVLRGVNLVGLGCPNDDFDFDRATIDEQAVQLLESVASAVCAWNESLAMPRLCELGP